MPREIAEVFQELSDLCISPGFVHAVAHLNMRDNVVRYTDDLNAKNTDRLFHHERLIRAEFCILLGLMVKGMIDVRYPGDGTLKAQIRRSDELLLELHGAINDKAINVEKWRAQVAAGQDPYQDGAGLEEAFFYSGEAAYRFQYEDFSRQRYKRDNNWLSSNRGFSIDAAQNVMSSIEALLSDNLTELINQSAGVPSGGRVLEAFTLTPAEVARYARVSEVEIRAFCRSFALSENGNQRFDGPFAFNAVNARPLIPLGDDKFALLHPYSLGEALYESPFYWMSDDADYVDQAARHRGDFIEHLTSEKLANVFGPSHVLANVDIYPSKLKRIDPSRRVGDVDVLVHFGDRAIVVQAKSKRLTLEARAGNQRKIKEDFLAAVQSAYDQGLKCAKALNDPAYRLVDALTGSEVAIPRAFKEIFVVCIVSDNYPALSVQARQFLRYELSTTIPPPFVLDVFTLDVMTEMLRSPLRLLSYLRQRTSYFERVLAMHETTVLAYHLRHNLWLNDDAGLFLDDSVRAELDVAMSVRRDGVQGDATPDGILTRFRDTPFAALIEDMERSPNKAAIDLGFTLLTLGEATVDTINRIIGQQSAAALRADKQRDATLPLPSTDNGLTFHFNDLPQEVAERALIKHCALRKYIHRAGTWFGLCLSPRTARMRFVGRLQFPWNHDAELERLTAAASMTADIPTLPRGDRSAKKKIGRNDPCPCGSGRKYKRCCL